MKPKFKARELIWLCLPLLLVSGVGWWRTRVTTTAIPTVPPEDTTKGAFRFVVAPWQPLPVSAGEVATGHTFKLGTRFWVAGQTTGRLSYFRGDEAAQNLHLQYQKGGAWHIIQSADGWNELRTWTSPGRTSQELDIALPMALVPSDADEVRLRGVLKSDIYERRTYDDIHHVQSAPIDVLVASKGRLPEPPQVNRQPSLEVQKLDTYLQGDAGNKESRRYNAKIAVSFAWNHSRWQKTGPTDVWFAAQSVQLLDENGQDWFVHQPPNDDDGWSRHHNLGTVKGFNEFVGFYGNDLAFWKASISTSDIPRSAGELRLKALVAPEYADGTSDWPTPIEAVVRPRWLTQRPSELTLQGVSVAMGHGEDYDKKLHPIVTADLLYTGTKPFFARGELESVCGYRDRPARHCWEDFDCATAQLSPRDPGDDYHTPLREAKPNENELLVSWSQKVEDEPSHTVTSSYKDSDAIKVLEPQINGNKIRVRYALNYWPLPEGRHRFCADIGLLNQGFIPVSIKLPSTIH